MDTYSVVHEGRVVGFYHAFTASHALELYAEDAGYASYESLCSEHGEASAEQYEPDTFGEID